MEKHVVYENIEDGTRFMISDDGGELDNDDKVFKFIGRGLEYDDAKALVKVTEDKNIKSYLDGLPKELRNPKMDAMIANMIRQG